MPQDINTGRQTVEGTVKSVVFHNEQTGYTVLNVELPSDFELARAPEITVGNGFLTLSMAGSSAQMN